MDRPNVNRSHVKDKEIDPETLPGKVLVPQAPPASPPPPPPSASGLALDGSSGDAASIDKLLAMTDKSWDIDEQVRSLQTAAEEDQPRIGADTQKRVPLALPSPFELAPAGGPALPSVPPPLPAAPPSGPPNADGSGQVGAQGPGLSVPAPPGASKPPPLPTRVSKPPPGTPSKRPPPLPRPPGVPSIAPNADSTGTGTGTGTGPPPLPAAAREQARAKDRGPTELARPEALVELLLARAQALEVHADDKVGLARAHIELAVAAEMVLADDARALAHAELALKVDPRLAAAHGILRRKRHSRSALSDMLEHLEHELAASTEEAGTIELLVEKARLLDAVGEKPEFVRQIWEQALTRAPHHAAALKGLEGELFARAFRPGLESAKPAAQGTVLSEADAQAFEALADHLARMADAYAQDPRLAAWLHVERAHILESWLKKVEAARGALERAVGFDPSVGPVRDACVRHVAAHDDPSALAALLEEEAQIETDVHRAARLELDAACIVRDRLGDVPRAIALLGRAAQRAPTVASVDRRVLDELVKLHEELGEWAQARRARSARLGFVSNPQVLAYELRALAALDEKLGDVDGAIENVQAAMQIDPQDPTLFETIDRLLAAAGRDEARVRLWLGEAAHSPDGLKRARALAKAAQIAENNLARPTEAVQHLRAAWVAAPGDTETLDALSRLLAPAPSEVMDAEARALIDLYAQAADTARDDGRKVAYLEKIALLWEEVVGEPRRASRVYEEILHIEPDRRGAVLGLSRTAARVGDDRALARALLDEARLAADGADVLGLRVRAATALARVDPARALSLVDEVLEQDGAHSAARALETRLHEEAGRWERAAQAVRARIANAPTPKEKIGLWLALAQIQDVRLRTPKEALESLQAARALDPTHPVPSEEIVRMLEATGDNAMLRDAIEQLATSSATGEDRVRWLVRAAEIDEHRLGDDARAALTYARAMADMPDDELLAERLERVLARRAKQSPAGLEELIALQTRRLEGAVSDPIATVRLSFDLAQLLVESGRDFAQVKKLLDSVLDQDLAHVPALRSLESALRRTNDTAGLARVLSRQGDAFEDLRARLGALWALASLEEWKLPAADAGDTYKRILKLDPTEPGALEASVRREMSNARRGDARARKSVIGALRSLYALASDDGSRLAIQLRLALMLDGSASELPDASAHGIVKEGLERYRAALAIDNLSVTAAIGLARAATRLHDTEGAVAAATSLAELSNNPRARARYLLDAAELLLGGDMDERLGNARARRNRAGDLLEKALDADPDSLAAAARLAEVRQGDREGEKLVDVFRAAIKRARTPDAIIMLGGEIARVARDRLRDLPLAIEAMRRVREAAPHHVPSLLTLAELCLAQRSWPEAVDALESVVTVGRDPAPRLTALFALASVYEHVLGRADESERALRTALNIDPGNARALRALLRHITNTRTRPGEELPRETRSEMADLLERLAGVERDAEKRCDILLELADLRQKLGERDAVERALIEAVAQSPKNLKAFARLSAHFRTSSGRDHAAFGRSLGSVIARGQQLGRVDARWYATLGQLEIDSLNRMRDGIAHLVQAVQLDPTLYETRYELARAYARAGANEDAARQLLGMIVPNSSALLSVKDPTGALALLEQVLGNERRSEEALVVSELRAVGGDLDDGRHAWLRARRLGPLEPHHAQLDRPALVTHVLPPEGRHVMLEVAAAVAGLESKILRADLTEIGISSRDRVGARSGHPTRALLDRLCRTLGLVDIELVIATTVTRTRVLAQDTLWVVVPRSLTDLPEPTQLASLGRALTRISLGVPWLEELPPPHIEALLIACARQVVHGYGADELDVLSQKLVTQYEPNVARALNKKQRKLLEELAPHIGAPQGRPIPIDGFISALARAELRAALLLSGDLLATIDELRSMDPSLFHATERPGPNALGAVLEHAFAGDVARFALAGEAMALRRRIGTAWTG